MALSGTLNTNAYDGRYYQLRWTATQSIPNNSSTISWTVSALGGGTKWFAERTLKVVIAGKTVIDKDDRVERYDGEVAKGSFTITHGADGVKSFPASIQVAVYASTVNCVGNGTYTLDPIPKQAIITGAPNFTDEDAVTVTYRNAAGNAVTSLDMAIGWTGADDIKYRSVSKTGTSYTFNFTNDEKIKLQDAVTGKNSRLVTIYLRTVISGITYYSRLQKTLTIANAMPTLDPVLSELNTDVSTLTGGSNTVLLGFSRIGFSANATAYKRATIVSVTAKNGSNTINQNSGIFNSIDSNIFTFEVVDSRGNSATQTVRANVVDYVPLTIHATLNGFETNGTANFRVQGSYFNGSFGAASNTLSLVYRIGIVGSSYSSWQTMNKTISGNSYAADLSVINLDYTQTYKIEIQAIDKLNTVTATEIRFSGRPIFEWGKDDFQFNVPVSFSGSPMTDFIVDQGVSGMWTYRKWNSGIMECWGHSPQTSVNVNSAWGNLYVNDGAFPNYAYPFKFNGHPVVQVYPLTAGGNFWLFTGGGANESQTPAVSIVRPTSSTVTAKISYYIVGKWK